MQVEVFQDFHLPPVLSIHSMKNFISLYFLLLAVTAQGQKEDYVWMIGSNAPPDSAYATSVIDFNSIPPKIALKYKFIGFDRTNANISDANGNLIAYTNGVHLFNSEDEIVQNGSNFYPSTTYAYGYVVPQAALLLPFPDKPNLLVFILCGMVDYYYEQVLRPGCSPLTYSIVDMNENNGNGKVIEKKSVLSSDTLLNGQLTAVKHGNGRDWWIIGDPMHGSNTYHKFLLSPQGIALHDEQAIGEIVHPGLGQAAISPNGDWIALYEWYGLAGATDTEINLYKFDRCSGQLSDHLKIFYAEGLPGGVAFSPNNRFMYIANWDKIYQFDLQASDIPASRITVAEYDGFLDERGLPTRFFNMKLAPDNKIYVNISNVNSRYLHVIDQPDSVGVACNVLQHSVLLPTYNTFSIPHHPVYRLGVLEGSPCDTLTSSIVDNNLPESKNWTVFPNPASGEITIKSNQALSGNLSICDIAGKTLFYLRMEGSENQYSLDVTSLPPGIYFLLFKSDDKVRLFFQKLVISK